MASRFHVTLSFDVAVTDLDELELRAASGGNVLAAGDPAVSLLAVLGNALDHDLLGSGARVLPSPGASIKLDPVVEQCPSVQLQREWDLRDPWHVTSDARPPA